jgi:hypothetical protein
MNPSKISDLLNKISKAIEHPDFPAVSKLECDLLKQHLRNLYDEVDALCDEPQTQKEPVAETLSKRPVIRPNDNLLMKEEPVVKKAVEPVKEEVITEKPVAKLIIKKAEPVVEKNAQTISGSINENIKSTGSLNEKLKTSSAVEMHKKLATKPLKELIDLNKKFVLLNELFKGNTEAYTAAITHIDTLADHETAQTFITTQLITNYAWDESKQSTRMFLKLVKMKFGVE